MSRFFFAAILLTAMACSAGIPPKRATPDDGTVVRGTGVITYLDFEGGFFGIVSDNGSRYDPGSLDEAFQEEGLRVRFSVRVLEGVMSIRMWGTPVEVIKLESVDTEQEIQPP